MKRIFFIIATVVVILGIGVVLYYLFFNNSPAVTVAPTGSPGLPVAEQGSSLGTMEDTSTTPANTPVVVSARLVQISTGPVVPNTVAVDLKTATSSEIEIRYIERQSGNVYSYAVGAKTITRTSNRTILGIQSAQWLPDSSRAFVRYLSGDDFSVVNSYALFADGSDGFFLSQNLSDIAVSSDRVLSISSGGNGSIASLLYIDGTSSKEAFTTPLSSIRVSFAGKNRYLVLTKPSAKLSGNAFFVDGVGHFTNVAGPLYGLVAKASPSGRWLLISFVEGGVMQTGLVDTTTRELISLPVGTIADKCVWASDDSAAYCGVPLNPAIDFNYPDDWYQGVVSFSDRIWKIDVSGRFAQLVLDFAQEGKGGLDVWSLSINPLGTVLVFTNKKDGSLWSYSL